jgi:hypothetical protein
MALNETEKNITYLELVKVWKGAAMSYKVIYDMCGEKLRNTTVCEGTVPFDLRKDRLHK